MKRNLVYTAIFIILFGQVSFSQTISLDATFGENGKVLHSFSLNGDSLNTIALQQDGKILVCGLQQFSLNGNVFISRCNADGTLDLNFGDNGIVLTPLVSEVGGNHLMKLQSDGKILVTGSKSNNSNLDNFDFATMRYASDGSVDTGFGTNGMVITDLNGKGDIGNAVDVQSDNKIIVVGYTYLNTNQNAQVSLVRYLNDGTLDTTFGTNGKQLLPLLASNSYDYTHSVKILPNDKILVGVATTALESLEDYFNFGVFKINSNGIPDVSFGNNGSVITDFGAKDYITALDEYNGNIVALGYSNFSGGSKMAIVKYLANGMPDTTFGVNGFFYGNRNQSNLYDAIAGMQMLSNGKMLCTGSTLNVNDADFLLIQFNADGTIDTGFNSSGYFMTDFINTNDLSGAMATDSTGKIVCAGLTDLNAIRVVSLARYDLTELSNTSFVTKNFSVYPNPFSESITIENLGKSITKSSVELFDSNGKKLYEYQSEETENFTIPLQRELAKGNYFLKIHNKEVVETLKIIKQ